MAAVAAQVAVAEVTADTHLPEQAPAAAVAVKLVLLQERVLAEDKLAEQQGASPRAPEPAVARVVRRPGVHLQGRELAADRAVRPVQAVRVLMLAQMPHRVTMGLPRSKRLLERKPSGMRMDRNRSLTRMALRLLKNLMELKRLVARTARPR